MVPHRYGRSQIVNPFFKYAQIFLHDVFVRFNPTTLYMVLVCSHPGRSSGWPAATISARCICLIPRVICALADVNPLLGFPQVFPREVFVRFQSHHVVRVSSIVGSVHIPEGGCGIVVHRLTVDPDKVWTRRWPRCVPHGPRTTGAHGEGTGKIEERWKQLRSSRWENAQNYWDLAELANAKNYWDSAEWEKVKNNWDLVKWKNSEKIDI